MKREGNVGDFIIYRKQGDQLFPVRICYVGLKLDEKRIYKLQIRQSEEGLYSLLKHNAIWFDSVSALIDGSEESYREILRHPFLGVNEI